MIAEISTTAEHALWRIIAETSSRIGIDVIAFTFGTAAFGDRLNFTFIADCIHA